MSTKDEKVRAFYEATQDFCELMLGRADLEEAEDEFTEDGQILAGTIKALVVQAKYLTSAFHAREARRKDNAMVYQLEDLYRRLVCAYNRVATIHNKA